MMTSSRPKKKMGRIITFLMITGNTIGATLVYFYLSGINQPVQTRQDLPPYYQDIFFLIVTGLLISFSLLIRRLSVRLYQVANDEVQIDSIDSRSAQILKKKAIQFPARMAAICFLI
ncbi:MAG: hypothetical protein JRD71_09715, partial [Deltaproteobacteria bacterium]|nr:hypothetical protein [Deltaproteobacteria bacterium]